ncbi:hypothetical protein [Halarcobacter bivalviorum]|uniref:DUF3649 domain-containing protein n=1 Tax=Halarcobacter bivalviorum TaxID=663364 RepID=A0AAX2A448_9BACT|nr:hypothetical protein [Halarcobacter bivalviorum]AXH11619.1 hypothetical protein ABIV_0606 [Halarcobacter bivalviorum]RXK08944.1 hypothetical protein CRV05_12950 [Halarcobacter bivalviorum]
MLKNIYTYLNSPEKDGKKIGLFRGVLSIIGGLLLAYLGMTLFALLPFMEVKEAAILSIMFNTFVWACATTWIALSISKLQALYRFIIPTSLFSIALIILY